MSRALLGVIILESREEKEQRIKEVKRDSGFKGEKGFYTNIVEELRVEDTEIMRNVKNEL